MTTCMGDGRRRLLVRLLALLWLGTGPSFARTASAGNAHSQITAMINLAATYNRRGVSACGATSQEAVDLVASSGDRPALGVGEEQTGRRLYLDAGAEPRESLLRESLEMARADGNSQMTAAILNDLGNVLGLRQKYTEALTVFQDSVTAAHRCGNKLLAAEALSNAASTAHGPG